MEWNLVAIIAVTTVVLWWIQDCFQAWHFFDYSVTIKASPQQIFSYFLEEAKLKEWRYGYVRADLVSGSPNRQGAVYKEFLSCSGQDMVADLEITELTPGSLLGAHIVIDGMFESKLKYIIESLDNGESKLTMQTQTRFLSPLYKFFSPVFHFMTRKGIKMEINNLVSLCEAEALQNE